MKLLFKYLRPYLLLIIIALVFLFIQAFTNLILPGYMSNLVNIGIQQGGIDEEIPNSIDKPSADIINSFAENDHVNFLDFYNFSNAQEVGTIKDLDANDMVVAKEIFKNSSYAALSLYNSNNTPLSNENINEVDSEFVDNFYNNLNNISKEEKSIAYSKAKLLEPLDKKRSSSLFSKLTYKNQSKDLYKIQNDYILNTGVKMLVITLIGAIATLALGVIASQVGSRVSMNFRDDIFKKVLSFSSKEYNEFATSSLITRTTNDVQQIQQSIVMGIRLMAYAPIVGVGGVIMAIRKSVSMSWLILLSVIVLMLIIGYIFSVVLPRFKIIQTLTDKLNLISRENLTGLLVVRAFNNENFEENRFNTTNREMQNTSEIVRRYMGRLMPSLTLIMNLTTLGILWVGSKQIANSELQVGDMMAFIQYTMMIIMSFLMLTTMFFIVPRSIVSLNRIEEVLSTNLSIEEIPNPVTTKISGDIRFENVCFKYDEGSNVLNNISFNAEKGKVTAIIGPTGSGKSTLIQLIPRFFDVTTGEVLIDDINIKNYDIGFLRENIGYIPQKNLLFKGSIESNLKFGSSNASDESMFKALEVAQAKDFILSSRDGLEKDISQEGSNLSGGQKQRLSIARALVEKKPIYIFDDSFSALDFKTDLNLRRELKKYVKDSTILIVAQRINSIIDADKIVVLENGKVVGIGTHESLMKYCPTYIDIAKSQLPEEELL